MESIYFIVPVLLSSLSFIQSFRQLAIEQTFWFFLSPVVAGKQQIHTNFSFPLP